MSTWKSFHGNPPFSPYTLNIRKDIHTLALYSYIKAITGRRRRRRCNEALHPVWVLQLQLQQMQHIAFSYVWLPVAAKMIDLQYLSIKCKKTLILFVYSTCIYSFKKSFLQIQMYLLIILNSRKFKWFTFFLFSFFIAKSVQNKQI